MKKCDCLLCSFENPKPTATAVAIKDQKLLVVKRNSQPYLGKWDFVGGYVDRAETPEKALRREIKEELRVGCNLTYIDAFSGTATYKGYKYPVTNFAYLTELKGKINLDTKENSELAWIPLRELKTIAFDSNQKILKFVKNKFTYDLERVRQLVSQLDPSANINEQSLYKAELNGFVSKVIRRNKLVGMGWIYPRQTMLRCQAVVEDMIVDENYRRQGLGEKILMDLITRAKKEGVDVIELTTNPKRVAANELYKKKGFWLHKTNHYLLNLK